MAIIFEHSAAPDPVDEAAERFAGAAMASGKAYRPSELVEIVAEKIALAAGPLAEGWFGSPTTRAELEADAADLEHNAGKHGGYEDRAARHRDLERASAAIARAEKRLAGLHAEMARTAEWHRDHTGLDVEGEHGEEIKDLEAGLKKLRKAKEAIAKAGHGDMAPIPSSA